ncbi:MAG: SRPBCC family protein [Turneriella sp.]|nr:SRPBCC family protein [Turneriella sp.]
MWSKTYTTTTNKVNARQMWQLLSDVNNWHTWDDGIEYAQMSGAFAQGNFFTLKPKGAPKVNIRLIEIVENRKFVDLTRFPLARMYGEHLLEETAQGLKITTTMKVEGLLGFLWRKLVAEDIAAALPHETEKQIEIASGLPA